MGRATRSGSGSPSRRTRRHRSRSKSQATSMRRWEDEGKRGRKQFSGGRRSESEDRWQLPGRCSQSPRPPRRRSRDRSSPNSEKQAPGSPKASRCSWSPGSSAASAESPRRSGSPGAAALALSRPQSLQERLRLREKQRQQEALLKALETPEEKRARRLAQKEAKEHKRREKMGWGEEYMGYTDTDNPFGDNNLLGIFIWKKALEKKGISHLEEKELKKRNKRIQEANWLELQKVKQLRLEREREKATREQELERLQREKEAEHFKTWEEQEDHFHRQQAKLRSEIRIRAGRAKPIDLLAKYISAEDEELAVEMLEPYTFLNGLSVADMEDLLEDIRVYMALEQGKNVDFWRDMTVITEDEISKLRRLEASGTGPGERREGVNASVRFEVQSVFKGKTYNQLQAIFQGIEGKIRAGGPNLDVSYWESLLQQLRTHMARARLWERHLETLRRKLSKLKREQGVPSEPLFPILKEESGSPEPEPGPTEDGGTAEAEGAAMLPEQDLVQQSLDSYDAGRHSPPLLRAHELPPGAHALEPEEDLQRLQLSRQRLLASRDASDSAEDVFLQRAREGMGPDEAMFGVEVPPGRAYHWTDKYRPRKPRFFNRVHTGFEWNKYNQTHYDSDNPPPKTVQGYKFNIFYPDLIDKRATPQYFLEASEHRDFATLRFHAGPPYEDIAFQIVSREWEYSHRHGFRCQFTNSIFQLWFQFKRYRYRR